MDSTMASTLIGGGIALAGSIVATFLAQWLGSRQERTRVYQERMEEMQELVEQVNMWMRFEHGEWWDMVRDSGSGRNTNRLPCPIGRLQMLVSRYEPLLKPQVSDIVKHVTTMQNINFEMMEYSLPEEEAYEHYIRPAYEKFDQRYKEVVAVFEKVNEKNAKKIRLS